MGFVFGWSRKHQFGRVFDGITQMPGKIVSLFEPHSEIIRKGKASKPTEFGKLVQVQETENQIITHYDVFDQRPSDRDLLSGAVEARERVLGRVPHLATADAGYYSRAQEQAVEDKGVKWVAVPNRSAKSAERKKKEHSRWFRNAQRWRTGCEGRISVLKRRHGLSRCRYRGIEGMKRWVGLGVMAVRGSIRLRRSRGPALEHPCLRRVLITFARICPPRSRTAATIALPSGPRPCIFSAFLSRCIFLALPPMKDSSASISPNSFPPFFP